MLNLPALSSAMTTKEASGTREIATRCQPVPPELFLEEELSWKATGLAVHFAWTRNKFVYVKLLIFGIYLLSKYKPPIMTKKKVSGNPLDLWEAWRTRQGQEPRVAWHDTTKILLQEWSDSMMLLSPLLTNTCHYSWTLMSLDIIIDQSYTSLTSLNWKLPHTWKAEICPICHSLASNVLKHMPLYPSITIPPLDEYSYPLSLCKS